jgi:hypothetical protein
VSTRCLTHSHRTEKAFAGRIITAEADQFTFPNGKPAAHRFAAYRHIAFTHPKLGKMEPHPIQDVMLFWRTRAAVGATHTVLLAYQS